MSRRIITLAAAAAVATGIATVAAVPAQAATVPPLTISVNQSAYTAGQHAIVKIHLGVPGGHQKVTLYETIPGHSPVAIATPTGDGHGNSTSVVTMVYNAYFEAKWNGQGAYATAIVHSRSIKVAALMLATFATKTKVSHGYHLVAKGKQAEYGVVIAPRKDGQKVAFPIQAFENGKWRTKVNHSYALTSITVDGQKVSAVGTQFHGTRGYAYRVRAQYNGDKYNTGHTAGWVYVKFS